MLFNKNKCNGIIEFNRQKGKFFLINEHNKICDMKDKKIFDNLADIEIEEIEVKKREDFKSSLITFLNFNPFVSYGKFKKKAIKYYLKNEYNFSIKKATLSNIYYSWRPNAKIFN